MKAKPATLTLNKLRDISLLFQDARQWFDPVNKRAFERRVRSRYAKLMHSSEEMTTERQLLQMYNILEANYQNEYVLKNELINAELRHLFSEPHAAYEEFRVNDAIVDILFINGEAKAFEIKSELDSLTRLNAQIRQYRQVFDKVYIITGSKLLSQTLGLFRGSKIGILEYQTGNRLELHQEAIRDSCHFDVRALFKLLRKPEYLRIHKEVFGEVPDCSNSQIFRACLDSFERLGAEAFQPKVMAALKERALQIDLPAALTSVPRALRLPLLQHKKAYSVA